jgi:hypothetical protein
MTTKKDRLQPCRADYYVEDVRMQTRRGQLFRLLADGLGHTGDQLAQVGGISFHASLHKFRQAGWQIHSERLAGGSWTYRLSGWNDPGQGQTQPPAGERR